jgi:hypothetical protein
MSFTMISRRAAAIAAIVLLFGLLFPQLAGATAPADPRDARSAALIPGSSDPASPSPTLGSTQHPDPAQPGDRDADPSDYSGAPWIVVGVVVFAVIVTGGTLYLFRGRRQDLSP